MSGHKKKTTLRKLFPAGFLVGFLSGLFGAGGGIIAVPALRRLGLEDDKVHATSLSITTPLAVTSGLLYLWAGRFSFGAAWPYLPGGFAGALAGALLLSRLESVWLRRIFAAVVLFLAGRLLLK